MKTPRKRITFKTPRKRQTPLVKSSAIKKRAEIEEESPQATYKRTNARKKELVNTINSDTLEEINDQIKKKEKESVDMYRVENQYLRDLKNDARLFKKFTGIEIQEHDGVYTISQSVMGRDGLKEIKFDLQERDGEYFYRLVETNCIDLPGFLQEDIGFNCDEVHKFFFEVLKVLVAKNV